MPRALQWTQDNDAQLMVLLKTHRMTLQQAANQLGVSRSFLQRRSMALRQQTVQCTCTADRAVVGAAPLPSGHVISWGAIVIPLQAAARFT